MRVKACNFIALTFTAYFAWLATFLLESFHQKLPSEEAMRERYREKGNHPPFPGAGDDNIIWFLQVQCRIKQQLDGLYSKTIQNKLTRGTLNATNPRSVQCSLSVTQ